jgi:hypothetical protein
MNHKTPATNLTYCPIGFNSMNKHLAESRPLSCVECEKQHTVSDAHFPSGRGSDGPNHHSDPTQAPPTDDLLTKDG